MNRSLDAAREALAELRKDAGRDVDQGKGTIDRYRWRTSRFYIEQFPLGLEVELEHATHDRATNVTDDDELVTGKIARAHLNEFPDYYTRLARMEAEAERDWAERERASDA